MEFGGFTDDINNSSEPTWDCMECGMKNIQGFRNMCPKCGAPRSQ